MGKPRVLFPCTGNSSRSQIGQRILHWLEEQEAQPAMLL